jgi:hypothetical protein
MASPQLVLNVKCDEEYNAEDFFAEMDEQFPSVMVQLRYPGVATISNDQWEAIQRIDGFHSDMPHAPTALVVIDE